ncbi:ubiquitin carboxyl-terminal hydrolase 8-like [Pangasianodon hypophthalmus]|uniref:ubiquitin carboxyl-terminal hydrolase 8-like n=1 Tax=Pangasianodon hypophthalmus TaxID=310915 RepID=UPI002307D73C|nr:ubiquitin carboxyl-terminal hydrolase 8-like [Pangasianodon hypophthalmus]
MPGQLSKTKKKTSTSHNEKSAERKQVSVKPASKLPGKKCIQGKEAGVKINLPSSMRISAMKEERKKTTQYGQEKKPTERKETTSNRLNMKKAETKQVSVRPTSKLPGTKRLEVKEAHVRTTAMRKEKEEKRTTTLHGQEKKTAQRKETTSNRPNMKTSETKPVIVSPISKHPWTKRIEVKEAHVRTNLQSSAGTTAMRKEKEERKEMTLHGQDRKEQKKEMIQFKSEDEMAKLMEVLMELAFSSYMEYKKRVRDPHAFSSKKMIPEGNINGMTLTLCKGNVKSPIPTPSEGNIKSPIPTPSEGNMKSPIPTPSEGNVKSPIPTLSEGNMKSPILTPSEGNINSTTLTLTLPPITDKQELTGGLPNFGNNCYVNASLQCLFTAESFCGELSYLLDNSVHKLEDTFLRCFVELSRLRKSSEVQGGISKDSLLLALIESATDINPEFTISQQNDAHEFLCHCLTQMEESGRWLGWQEDVDPRCPVRANFKFKMRNIITCSSCGSRQNKVEVFNHISLPLVHNSVDQCLYDIVNNPTVLESKCKMCGGECANSRWTFHTLPRFLILQLNRFKVTEYYTVVKLHMPVEIKPELQINCHPQSDTPEIGTSQANN